MKIEIPKSTRKIILKYQYRDAADKLGVSTATIFNWKRRLGIRKNVNRGRLPIPISGKARSILSGMCLRAAAKELGISKITASRWRDRLGIEPYRHHDERRRLQRERGIAMSKVVIALQSLERAARKLRASRQRVYQLVKPHIHLVWNWRDGFPKKAFNG